ncbi:MAG: glycine/sarcosine/betaine reductase selenoprotein B family protein [Myxococcota bacterium]
MIDARGLEAWGPKFAAWTRSALPLIREGKAKQAFAGYPWFRTEGDPFVRLGKPASETRFGLITTGGYSIEGEQEPFVPLPRFDDQAAGLRAIPLDVDRSKLRIDHPGYDHRFAEQDPNVNLPLDRLRELAQAGEIGSIAKDSLVLMGLQPNVAPLIRETIPEIAARLASDSVEAALLVPS